MILTKTTKLTLEANMQVLAFIY